MEARESTCFTGVVAPGVAKVGLVFPRVSAGFRGFPRVSAGFRGCGLDLEKQSQKSAKPQHWLLLAAGARRYSWGEVAKCARL